MLQLGSTDRGAKFALRGAAIGGSVGEARPILSIGWLQYAHPEHATRGPNGDVQVPGVNGGEALRYGIVKRVPPGARVLHAVTYRRIIAPSGRIYVIDQMPRPSS